MYYITPKRHLYRFYEAMASIIANNATIKIRVGFCDGQVPWVSF